MQVIGNRDDILRRPENRPLSPVPSGVSVTCEVDRHDTVLGCERVRLETPEMTVTSPAMQEDQRGIAPPANVVDDPDSIRRSDRVRLGRQV